MKLKQLVKILNREVIEGDFDVNFLYGHHLLAPVQFTTDWHDKRVVITLDEEKDLDDQEKHEG